MASPLAGIPLFNEIATRITVDKFDRVELSTLDLDPTLIGQALQLTTSCCRCGATIHPFRRRSQAERSAPSTGPVYVSLVCPMAVRAGCARGKAADAAKASLIRDVCEAKAKAQTPVENTYAGDPEWLAEFLEGMNAGLS